MILYTAIVSLLLWPALIWLAWPRRGMPWPGRRLLEYLGGGSTVEGAPLWVHAASVGEVNACAPLVKTLLARYPNVPLLITTMTATGAARTVQLFGEQVTHRFVPLDHPLTVALFLRRHRPRLLVLVEMELWPAMLHGCRRRGIPSILVNGRLSDRTTRGYGKFRALVAPALQCLSSALMQSPNDARRLRWLGMPHATVGGNLKFDLHIDDTVIAAGAALKTAWGARPVWMAASTHHDEESRLLVVHRHLRERFPELLLVLVPRHPQRFDAVAELVRNSGLAWARRSAGTQVDGDTAVYLGDTMGELLTLTAAVDLVVMGGTFIVHGGQNPLEAAALGKPVVLGPSTYNFRDAVRQLTAAGGAVQVADMAALEQQLATWLSEPDKATEAGCKARQVMVANRGALERTAAAIEDLLVPEAGSLS